jgi:hypothetical protein
MAAFLKKVWQKIVELFSLDYRSLALLRIGVGLTVLLDLLQRAQDIPAFYTDAGILPRLELFRFSNMDWLVSIHLASGDLWFQIVLFIIAGIAALALIVGYRTRAAVILSWFLLISIQNRNPLILFGGDVVLRCTLFFMMFLPIAACWSFDRFFNRIPAVKKKTVADMATVGYIVQACALYIFAGLLKSGFDWHAGGTAIYYALSLDQFSTHFGRFLLNFPALLPLLTHAVLYYETFGTILFFIPWRNWIFRTIGVLGFICMQLGINISMRLGLFGMITITALFGLFPPEFWDVIVAKIWRTIARKGKAGLTIVYDFDCTFCHKVSMLLGQVLLLNPATRIIPSSADAHAQKIMQEKNSWVIMDSSGSVWTGWRGLVEVFRYSSYGKVFSPVLSLFSAPGEKLYAVIARKRKMVCNPEPLPKKKNFVVVALIQLFLAAMVVYIILWNLSSIGHSFISPQLRFFAYTTDLDQEFNLFAPSPTVDNGWYVFPGLLRDGSSVNVFTGSTTVSYGKPANAGYVYENNRWQKYMMNLSSSAFAHYRSTYAQYVCRTWNASHPYGQQLISFDMDYMSVFIQPPGEIAEQPVKEVLGQEKCS